MKTTAEAVADWSVEIGREDISVGEGFIEILASCLLVAACLLLVLLTE